MPALLELLRHLIVRRFRTHYAQGVSGDQTDQKPQRQFGEPDNHCPTTLDASCPEKLAQFSAVEWLCSP